MEEVYAAAWIESGGHPVSLLVRFALGAGRYEDRH